ncbi:PREDICTED: uncharacterized protein LOC105582682 [Cercocebus atys]|uniref:uncharacterized protein LOC105582682 n=1 Tax=Cercocebus atys TaxID=9531 RepID=UPI0005F4B21E|nr:PREDICTED: uncharacterized protein LOC105582682 [Cercocebus atys]
MGPPLLGSGPAPRRPPALRLDIGPGPGRLPNLGLDRGPGPGRAPVLGFRVGPGPGPGPKRPPGLGKETAPVPVGLIPFGKEAILGSRAPAGKAAGFEVKEPDEAGKGDGEPLICNWVLHQLMTPRKISRVMDLEKAHSDSVSSLLCGCLPSSWLWVEGTGKCVYFTAEAGWLSAWSPWRDHKQAAAGALCHAQGEQGGVPAREGDAPSSALAALTSPSPRQGGAGVAAEAAERRKCAKGTRCEPHT